MSKEAIAKRVAAYKRKQSITNILAYSIIYGVVALIFCGCLYIGYLKNAMESSAYNRLCGAQTTWLDAVFVELRVDGNCKVEKG